MASESTVRVEKRPSLEDGSQEDSKVEETHNSNLDLDSNEIDEALDEIRQPWVLSKNASLFSNHQSLIKYWRKLKVMVDTLHDYANNDEENNHKVIEAVYEYIMHALSTYLDTVYSWIDNAKRKEKQAISVPVLPRVQKLLDLYNASLKDKIKKYYERALRSPWERSIASSSSCTSQSAASRFSDELLKFIQSMMKQHDEEMSKLSEKIVDMTVATQLEQQKWERAEKERKRAKEEQKHIKDEEELLWNKTQKERESYLKEKWEFFKQKKKEIAQYKQLTEAEMFPDAATLSSSVNKETPAIATSTPSGMDRNGLDAKDVGQRLGMRSCSASCFLDAIEGTIQRILTKDLRKLESCKQVSYLQIYSYVRSPRKGIKSVFFRKEVRLPNV